MTISMNFIKNSVSDGVLFLAGIKLSEDDVLAVYTFLQNHPEVKVLDVSCSSLDCKGAMILAQNNTLIELNASYNDIGDQGITALSENGVLKTLDVRHNKIGDGGANSLLLSTELINLNATGNLITKTLLNRIDSQIKRNLAVSERKRALPMGFFQNSSNNDKKTYNFNFSFI